MALNSTALITGATAIKNQITHMSLHTTGAVTSSANESAAARVAASGSVNGTTGVITWTNIAFTGGAASGPVVRVGYWSASTAGTYLGGSLLSGDATFNSAGEYTVTSVTETPSAS